MTEFVQPPGILCARRFVYYAMESEATFIILHAPTRGELLLAEFSRVWHARTYSIFVGNYQVRYAFMPLD